MRNYTDKEWQWLCKNVPDSDWKTITEKFNRTFHKSKSLQSLKTHCNRHGVYAKGALDGKPCWNAMEIGHECPTNTGYIRVKTENGYKMKSHIAFGDDVHKGYKLIYKDGNIKNNDKSNLILVSKRSARLMALMHRWNNGFNGNNPQVKLTAYKWCDLHIALKENENV